MQLATLAGAGIQLQAYRYRLEADSEVLLHVSAIALLSILTQLTNP